jgi:hypothetical protein
MTDEHDEKHDEPMDDGPSSGGLRDLLRRTADAPVPPPKTDVLQGVQRRLRQRSRGKFYADGWSTREESPRGTYLITAAVMLFVVLVLYYMLAPAIY